LNCCDKCRELPGSDSCVDYVIRLGTNTGKSEGQESDNCKKVSFENVHNYSEKFLN
jgi:hypothetical protein